MKVCITGKGGSGKSVVTVLLARALEERGRRVLVVDADESNLGLKRMLGFGEDSLTLMAAMGGKAGVKMRLNAAAANKPMEDKHQARIFPEEKIYLSDLPAESLSGSGKIRLIQIGKIEQALEGCACPMGILSREFLSKLVLEPDVVALVDMEAGVEHFGRGVEASADAVVVVVDPSFESVLLAEKISGLAAQMGKRVMAVLNKVPEEAVETMKQELVQRGISVSAIVNADREIFSSCLQGKAINSLNPIKQIEQIATMFASD